MYRQKKLRVCVEPGHTPERGLLSDRYFFFNFFKVGFWVGCKAFTLSCCILVSPVAHHSGVGLRCSQGGWLPLLAIAVGRVCCASLAGVTGKVILSWSAGKSKGRTQALCCQPHFLSVGSKMCGNPPNMTRTFFCVCYWNPPGRVFGGEILFFSP